MPAARHSDPHLHGGGGQRDAGAHRTARPRAPVRAGRARLRGSDPRGDGRVRRGVDLDHPCLRGTDDPGVRPVAGRGPPRVGRQQPAGGRLLERDRGRRGGGGPPRNGEAQRGRPAARRRRRPGRRPDARRGPGPMGRCEAPRPGAGYGGAACFAGTHLGPDAGLGRRRPELRRPPGARGLRGRDGAPAPTLALGLGTLGLGVPCSGWRACR